MLQASFSQHAQDFVISLAHREMPLLRPTFPYLNVLALRTGYLNDDDVDTRIDGNDMLQFIGEIAFKESGPTP